MAETVQIEKGPFCKDCWNCMTRVFGCLEDLQGWTREKGLRLQDHTLERWEKTASKGILRLYWCKVQTPISPTTTPLWKKKSQALGCLGRV